MGRPPRFSEAVVRDVAQEALARPIEKVEHMPVGWGNENWRVDCGEERFILKLGPPDSAAKWAATHDTYRVAGEHGLPVPELVWFNPALSLVNGWTVRVFTWMDGVTPDSALVGDGVSIFFRELGSALRSLHRLPTEGFTSRLDGSAPSFDRWSRYVEYRIPRVLDRVAATTAFQPAEADAIAAKIRLLAHEVDPVARPAICHRDIYLDNLLATPAGHLSAILDFDGAEAWDPAIDVVKLRWLVFPTFAEAEPAFMEAYGEEPMWTERVRLVELLELLNAVPNAIASRDPDFERSARDRLLQVLAAS